jgi:hypothetical protein
VHCGAEVEIPIAYRKLRDEQASRATADASAQAMYRRLARRPAWILRVLSGWFNPVSLALFAFPAMFIAGVLVELFAVWIASAIGPANYFDTWFASRSSWDAVLLGFAFAYLGTILAAFGQRRALSLCGLQQAMAARPPRIAGGAAQCRQCGAPLFAEEGRLGVACAYCGTDNLLVVPEPWVKRLSEGTLRLLREVSSARDAIAAEDARVRRSMLWYVLCASLLAPLFLVAFRQTIGERRPELTDWPPIYALYRAAPEPLVIEHRLVERSGSLYPDARLSPASRSCADRDVSIESSLTPERCHGGTCELRYYAALARGDRLAVVATSVPDDASIQIERHRGLDWNADDDWRTPRPEFGAKLVERALSPGQPIELEASIDAWHRIAIRFPDRNTLQSAAICVEVIRGRST